ncbi:MAG TPA: ZIP family metal transporter [Fimbriimonas sp.]|nr:ZIP family metal transporter [Fimbriimonas sp.]
MMPAALTACVLSALAGTGASMVWRSADRRFRPVVVVAAIALLVVVLADLLPEAWSSLSLASIAVAVGAGFVFVWAVGSLIAPLCPACAVAEAGSRPCLKRGDVVVGLVLALHCVQDGLALSVGHSALFLPLALALHKAAEGFALGAMLLASGRSARWVLAFSFLVQSTTWLGGVLGSQSEQWLSVSAMGSITAALAGGFLYLAGSALGWVKPLSVEVTMRPFGLKRKDA